MCSNYVPTQAELWTGLHRGVPLDFRAETYPGYEAPYVRRTASGPEARLGRFGLVPFWTKPEGEKAASRHTYNARSETVAQKPSFRSAWKQGQFCLIPAEAIYEPRYGAGRPVRWRIERADRRPMGIAGIWGTWRAPDGREVESFAMLTVNADGHELMQLFHAPEDEKRMVVILEEEQYEPWLAATPAEAVSFLDRFPAEMLTAKAEPKPGKAVSSPPTPPLDLAP